MAFDKRGKLSHEIMNLRCGFCWALDDDVSGICRWVVEVAAKIRVVHAIEVILKFAFEKVLGRTGAVEMTDDRNDKFNAAVISFGGEIERLEILNWRLWRPAPE